MSPEVDRLTRAIAELRAENARLIKAYNALRAEVIWHRERAEYLREYKRKCRADPGERERENAMRRERRADPKYRERENAMRRERRADPEYRERENARARERRRQRRGLAVAS